MVESGAIPTETAIGRHSLAATRTNGKRPAATAFVALEALTSLPPTASLRPRPEDGPPCHLCTARCCKYFALAIDTPKDAEDYDFIRWYLMHEHVAVWKHEGDWYLEVRTRCKNLLADDKCAVYETRPQVCREYGWPDEENPEVPCDFFNDGTDYEIYFEDAEKFHEWAKIQLAEREERLARRRERDRARKAKAREAAEAREACA